MKTLGTLWPKENQATRIWKKKNYLSFVLRFRGIVSRRNLLVHFRLTHIVGAD